MLAVIPHPDDEVLGAGGALCAARAAGQPAAVLAVALGRPAQHERRRRELERSCAVLDVELALLDPPLAISRGDPLELAHARLVDRLMALLAHARAPWVVAPSVHDCHPAHELVGRAVRDAIELLERDASVWWWRLWGQGGPATTAVVADAAESILQAALACHQGELGRNRYGELLACRLRADAILGVEQIFGFGSRAWSHTLAATYCETIYTSAGWRYAAPRVITPRGPFGPGEPGARDAGGWLHSPSP